MCHHYEAPPEWVAVLRKRLESDDDADDEDLLAPPAD